MLKQVNNRSFFGDQWHDIVFSCYYLLKQLEFLKCAPSRELPLTARKTVFSHLKEMFWCSEIDGISKFLLWPVERPGETAFFNFPLCLFFSGLVISEDTRKAAMRAAKASVKNKKVNGKLRLMFQYFGGDEGTTPAVTG